MNRHERSCLLLEEEKVIPVIRGGEGLQKVVCDSFDDGMATIGIELNEAQLDRDCR